MCSCCLLMPLDFHKSHDVVVITPFGVLLLIYKADAPRVRSTRGRGLVNRNSTTKGVIINLLIVVRWYDVTTR